MAKQSNGRGRPPYEPNDQDRVKIKFLIISGVPVAKAAEILGVSKTIIYKHYKKEVQNAAAEATAQVAGNLYRMTKTNPAAAIFWMKTSAKWRETDANTESRPYRIVLEAEPEPARLRIVK